MMTPLEKIIGFVTLTILIIIILWYIEKDPGKQEAEEEEDIDE